VLAGFTVNDTVVLCVRVPSVPVIVIVAVPVVVLLVVLMVSVDDPEPPLMEAGLKFAVAPEGRPVALSVTVPAYPLAGLTVAVYVVLFPAVTVCEAGDADSEKSAGGSGACTVKVTLTECVGLPLLSAPVIVTV